MATAPPTDPFFITGDSHADLERMSRALGAADYEPAFRHDPGPVNGCAPGLPDGPVAEAARAVRVQLEALRTVLGGRPTLLLLTEAVDDLHYAGADYRARTIMLEETTRRLGNDVDAARSLAARLEEEVARLTDPWLGRYLQALEDAVSEEVRDRLVAEANASWREAGSPAPAGEPAAVAMPDPGLPIVDDASLPEHAVQFLSPDGAVLATGQLQVFGTLDQATQIAIGAVQVDLPGEGTAHPLDELDADDDLLATIVLGELVTWPDGTQWRWSGSDGWQLVATPQNEGRWAHVACPVTDESIGSRRVDVGNMWGPFGDPPEFPRAQPPGPPTPPRPPHHNPVA
jgi:hypothetical protein